MTSGLGCQDRLAFRATLAQFLELAFDRQVQSGRPSYAALGDSGNRQVDAWVWDLETREVKAGPLVHQFAQPRNNTPTPVVAWSRDGRRLATAVGPDIYTVMRPPRSRSGTPERAGP